MYPKSVNRYLILLLFLCLLLLSAIDKTVFAAQASPQTTDGSYFIQDIKADISAQKLEMVVHGNSPPTFTQYETFNTFRIVIDIAEAQLSQDLNVNKLLPKNPLAKLKATPLKQQDIPLVRFELQIPNDASYSVDKDGNNLVVKITTDTALVSKKSSRAAQARSTLKLLDVTTESDQTKVLISADQTITSYNSDIVAKTKNMPDRMFIDIDNVNGKNLPKEQSITNSVIKRIRVAKRGTGVRIVFDSSLDKLFSYSITPDPEGLLVVVTQPTEKSKAQGDQKVAGKETNSTDSTLDALLDSSKETIETGLAATPGSTSSGEDILDKYDFSGYKKKRISIDFYKIDIHNIFRLLREITDLNIVVDEAVNGTLTLALNDVPWDFALDIILNLTDLEKEERYNTIVINPKKKKFVWPTRATDNLEVQVDLEIVQEEELVVKRAASQPKEIIQAKSLLRMAQEEENGNNLTMAASYYEQAFKLWPKNHNIGDKLASLYLVGLKMNAKAVNYAKRSLRIEPKNSRAALYAAIGLANMNRFPEAIEYCNQSVSDSPPLKDALVSYATFSENNDQPEAALKILDKFESYYGDDLNTMITRARIYDKLGQTDKAAAQYRAILHSGFQIRPDMKKFIHGRIAAKNMTTGE